MRKWKKGDKVMARVYGDRIKAVYVKPAAREGWHFVRWSTESGGMSKSVPIRVITERKGKDLLRRPTERQLMIQKHRRT